VKILLVNWQDRLNPLAGGAEIHLHEIFGRLARRGHQVTLLTCGWPGAEARLTLDGMDVHRVASRYSFGPAAIRAARRLLRRERFDVLVEALNKVPIFSPVWSSVPPVVLVHHLFGASAFEEAPIPIAAATWLLERPVPRVYRGVPVQAISHSTADDLVARGLRSEDIEVIHPGVDVDFYSPSPSDPRLDQATFLYLGRLKRYKRIDLVLRALAMVRQRGIDVRLIVAGRGEQEVELRSLADSLETSSAVDFAGFVAEDEKRTLFRQCWANVFVSPKEGWGITNLEAAACGTATIASDSPGLRESVVHETTGILVRHGDVEALAVALTRLARNRRLTDELGRAAREFARRFTWDSAADRTAAHLLGVLRRQTNVPATAGISN
jgi:glycosyltransferase involved in cell wall biosynthesis